jgi:hypothetical protein
MPRTRNSIRVGDENTKKLLCCGGLFGDSKKKSALRDPSKWYGPTG